MPSLFTGNTLPAASPNRCQAPRPTIKPCIEQAVGWTSLVNGWYNIVTFISAFGLMWLARRYSAKQVHTFALSLAAAALLIFPHMGNKYLFVCADDRLRHRLGQHYGRAVFLIAVAEIPESALRRVYGHYQYDDCGAYADAKPLPSSAGFYRTFLGTDSTHAITFAGLLMVCAGAGQPCVSAPANRVGHLIDGYANPPGVSQLVE